MIDSPTRFQVSIKCELTLQHGDGARTELDNPVLAGLGRILVDPVDSGFGNRQGSSDFIEVPYFQGNLLRGPKPGEESKLVEVALWLTPISMDRGNESLGILDSERVDSRRKLVSVGIAFKVGR